MEDKLKMGVEDNDSKKLEQQKLLTGGQDISKRCPQRFLGSSVTNRYIPFSQKANERIRDLELFRSNTPKSLCCKEFSQLVPLSAKTRTARVR